MWIFVLANAPTITAPGAVNIQCNQAIATSIKKVIFTDVNVGDTPTISITNPAAPNNIFSIDATQVNCDLAFLDILLQIKYLDSDSYTLPVLTTRLLLQYCNNSRISLKWLNYNLYMQWNGN